MIHGLDGLLYSDIFFFTANDLSITKYSAIDKHDGYNYHEHIMYISYIYIYHIISYHIIYII